MTAVNSVTVTVIQNEEPYRPIISFGMNNGLSVGHP